MLGRNEGEKAGAKRRRRDMIGQINEPRSFEMHPHTADNGPDESWTDGLDAWDAVASSALIHRVRWHTGLTQAEFSDAYRIDINLLRALERGSLQPDSALVAYLTVIDRAPEMVRAALRTC